MEDEQVDQEEVWSSIRCLDPDGWDKDRKAKSATRITVSSPAYDLRCLGRALAESSRTVKMTIHNIIDLLSRPVAPFGSGGLAVTICGVPFPS